MNNKYFWQGEPVKTDFGVAYPKENKEKPLYWYNYECNWDIVQHRPKHGKGCAIIPAIKITTKEGNSFIIANHYGIGAHKLMNGGWPNYAHFSFDEDVEFEGVNDLPAQLRNKFSIRNFDEESFSKYESDRRNWQKKNYPHEFEESERMREMIRSMKSSNKTP